MVGRLFMRGSVMSTYGGSSLHEGVSNEYLLMVGLLFMRGLVMCTYSGRLFMRGVCNEYLRWVVST